jgi:hypothetical protein
MPRLRVFLPRLVAVTAVWLLLTAAVTYAAGRKLATPKAAPAAPTAAAVPAPAETVVVPDVRGQAYVFAKGMLEEAGFAWTVTGSVQGYAANTVAAQVPAPGTRVVDTGTPTIQLRLARGSYPQTGDPENASPFAGTELKLPTAEHVGDYATAKPTARPKAKAKSKAAPKAEAVPHDRKPDFTFPGQRPEPQGELPLPERARRLGAWLDTRPALTDANVSRWLYQHAWVVSGAQEGWWHGAEALRLLIAADRSAQSIWGIGSKSETIARSALADVRARS